MSYIDKQKEVLMKDLSWRCTVWVGGTEVNDSLLEYNDAMEIADSYKKKGHADVIVECVDIMRGVL